MRVALLGTTADTLAFLEHDQIFHEDSGHWVAAKVGMDRPLGHCIGELTVEPLAPLPSSAVPDTLFLMHGSIPDGAIC